jgi:hypothetical protein
MVIYADQCNSYYAIVGTGFTNVNTLGCDGHDVIVFHYGLRLILNRCGFTGFSVGVVHALWAGDSDKLSGGCIVLRLAVSLS